MHREQGERPRRDPLISPTTLPHTDISLSLFYPFDEDLDVLPDERDDRDDELSLRPRAASRERSLLCGLLCEADAEPGATPISRKLRADPDLEDYRR